MKRVFLYTSLIILVTVILVVSYFTYVFSNFLEGMSECGTDDGPFEAVFVSYSEVSDEAKVFQLAHNYQLYLDNRTDSLPPLLILKRNDSIHWSLNMNTQNTKGYENTHLTRLSQVTIKENDKNIDLKFNALWTFGSESGNMRIDRESGNNWFCLS